MRQLLPVAVIAVAAFLMIAFDVHAAGLAFRPGSAAKLQHNMSATFQAVRCVQPSPARLACVGAYKGYVVRIVVTPLSLLRVHGVVSIGGVSQVKNFPALGWVVRS
jgi:hypothetical protein